MNLQCVLYRMLTLFQRFARFEKAGYQPVERAAEVACMHQQYFFAFPYQHE